MIEQDIVEIEVCRRAKQWPSDYYFLGDEVYFASLKLTVPVGAIYARVNNEDMKEYLKLEAEPSGG